MGVNYITNGPSRTKQCSLFYGIENVPMYWVENAPVVHINCHCTISLSIEMIASESIYSLQEVSVKFLKHFKSAYARKGSLALTKSSVNVVGLNSLYHR